MANRYLLLYGGPYEDGQLFTAKYDNYTDAIEAFTLRRKHYAFVELKERVHESEFRIIHLHDEHYNEAIIALTDI